MTTQQLSSRTRLRAAAARSFISTLGTIVALSATGCDDEAGTPDTYFEGTEIADRVRADPDAIFVVDMKYGVGYEFDQRQETIDFSRFLIKCPSMDSLQPMEFFAQTIELDLSTPYWEMGPAAEMPRSGNDEGYWKCNEEGEDCLWHIK
ncbi:MAG: hypothetical protein ACRBN8_44125 [Nannocystales bacterium]